MLSDGSEVTVREGEVEETSCKCCTAPVTVVTGYLDVGDYSAGWYTVGVTHNQPGGPVHLPLIRLYLGDWTDQAGADERWGLRIGISAEGPELLDWSETDRTEAAPVFTPLDRAQVLGTPMEPQLFTLIDRVLRDDSRL